MNFTFLTDEQIFGSNGMFAKKKLDIFEKINTEAVITDFSILLGGYVGSYTYNDSGNTADRTGWYWTKSEYSKNARAVDANGDRG